MHNNKNSLSLLVPTLLFPLGKICLRQFLSLMSCSHSRSISATTSLLPTMSRSTSSVNIRLTYLYITSLINIQAQYAFLLLRSRNRLNHFRDLLLFMIHGPKEFTYPHYSLGPAGVRTQAAASFACFKKDLTTSNLLLPLVGGVKLVLLLEGSIRDGDGFDRLKKIIGIKLVFLHSVIHSIGL